MVLCTYVRPYIDTHTFLCTLLYFEGANKLLLLLRDQPKKWKQDKKRHDLPPGDETRQWPYCFSPATISPLPFWWDFLTLKIWADVPFTRRLPYFWEIRSLVNVCCFCKTIQMKTLSLMVFTPITRKIPIHSGISAAPCTLLLATKKEGRSWGSPWQPPNLFEMPPYKNDQNSLTSLHFQRTTSDIRGKCVELTGEKNWGPKRWPRN